MPAARTRTDDPATGPGFPRTRYQGSKRRTARTIVHHLQGLPFRTVLDAFGGTGAVSHAFKAAGYEVTYNDLLCFNHQIGLALIENDDTRIEIEKVESLGLRRPDVSYGDTIERHFEDIYFTTEENRWLDLAVGNIRRMTNACERAIAWFALFQSAMAKRPYNLFHRRNLYLRTAEVERSFGNKASWDRGFPEHMRVFAEEANQAVIEGHGTCRAICRDALTIEPGYDLVYIDPPYINRAGVGVNYRDFYHFLEGMLRYDEWPCLLDDRSKHKRLRPVPNPWCDARTSEAMFRALFHRFRESILVVSYRDDGIPSLKTLESLVRAVKKRVRVIHGPKGPYALSTKRDTREVLIIGT